MMIRDALRAEALAAREADDPNRAVRAWRALLDLVPDDWAVGLELRRDLRAGLHYPDSDARFRRAARSLPDDEWLEHYSFFYTFHGGELEAIDARARAMAEERPGEARLQVILGDVASQRRDWVESVRAFSAALRLDAGLERCVGKLATARLYRRIEAGGVADVESGGAGPGYAVLVINLDRSAVRMVEIERQFAGMAVRPRRLSATDGALVPLAAARRLAGRDVVPPGTLGCFMSHVAAWEALLAGEEECALVIEDDVIPQVSLPAGLGGLGLPPGWDVVWVNDRMAPQVDLDAATGFTVHGLAGVMRGFWPETTAPGADGYLISREGARKLLAWVTADGMADDVDWRMVAYGLTREEVEAIPAGVYARGELLRVGSGRAETGRLETGRLETGRLETLRAFVLHPPLIREVGTWSERMNADRGEIE